MTEKLNPDSKRGVNESGEKNSQELTPFKENWKVNFGVLTISGESGTGKSTLADILAVLYKIPEERNIKVGKKVSLITEKTNDEGFMERPLSTDVQVDNSQKIIMQKANSDCPYLIEGRLSGLIAYEEKTKSPQLPIISILLTASPDIRIGRLQKRKSELSRVEIINNDKERSENDLKQWKTIHKDLKNPYDDKYFNLIIDTDSMSNEQVFFTLHSWLSKNGLVKKEDKSNILSNEGQIFPTLNV